MICHQYDSEAPPTKKQRCNYILELQELELQELEPEYLYIWSPDPEIPEPEKININFTDCPSLEHYEFNFIDCIIALDQLSRDISDVDYNIVVFITNRQKFDVIYELKIENFFKNLDDFGERNKHKSKNLLAEIEQTKQNLEPKFIILESLQRIYAKYDDTMINRLEDMILYLE